MKKKPKLGECCPVMAMIIKRDVDTGGTPRGFEVAPMFSLESGKHRDALVYRFTKAKKTNTTEHGYMSKFRDATYATIKCCPFCAAQIPQDSNEVVAR